MSARYPQGFTTSESTRVQVAPDPERPHGHVVVLRSTGVGSTLPTVYLPLDGHDLHALRVMLDEYDDEALS